MKPASLGLDHSALTIFGIMLPAIFLIAAMGSPSKKAARSRKIGTALALLLLVVVLINGCGGNPRGPTAAQPKIGKPVDLGSNNASGSGTVSMTTTAAAPAGGSIIVMAADQCARSCFLISLSCTDSAGNSYTTEVSQQLLDNGASSICSSHHLAAALPAGATITATFNGVISPSGPGVVIRAIAVTGLASAPLDRTASASSSGAAPSSGNAATTMVADELLVGVISTEPFIVANGSFTPGSGYTALAGVDSLFGGEYSLFGEYKIVSATGVYAADGTLLGTNPPWVALLATYKAAP